MGLKLLRTPGLENVKAVSTNEQIRKTVKLAHLPCSGGLRLT